MPVSNDHVHDAVMYIKKAIAAYENPARSPEHGYPFIIRAIHSLELAESYIENPEEPGLYCEVETLRRCRNAEFIDILNRVINSLHQRIGVTPPSNDPNQLKINFDGE